MQFADIGYGFMTTVTPWLSILSIIVVCVLLGYTGATRWLWTLAGAAALFGFGAPLSLWVIFGIVLSLLTIQPLRQVIVTGGIVKILEAMKFLPTISETERTAIEAGNTWIDGELFSGKPNFKRILNESYPDLTAEEKAFMDGPVEELCRITNDWEVFRKKDLPQETWDYIKEKQFFGIIIPKKYGGLGFSPSAHSAIIAKLASRSSPLSTTVMVPNSLGPAELLLHYGTEEQKGYYLPRLARGEDIPSFALTEPGAGSDAGAITSDGIVFRGDDGQLYIRLNWKKRYITLAAISTVLGLAFKLRDPENLLGKGENPGITCALIPTDTAGVILGRRHDPLGIPFYNSPTEGHDVVVPLDTIIGGPEQAGNGWRMLMESLAVGRGISLPASATGGVRMATRVVSAYAAVRKQFGLSIGKFEGIEEPLARLGGYAYLMEAARRYTCGALDSGQKPAVVTAIAKYHFTELLRKAVNDAMDIMGGAGISRGPRNLIAHAYMGVPISITVEGANILTRTLMIFGQGAIRCHPYAFKEINALMKGDVAGFDRAFWPHIGHVIRNLSRSVLLSVTRGFLLKSPVKGPTAKYYRKISWSSASFALLADIAMGMYGGRLKRMEKITGRFADIFSWMYLGTATLRRFEAEGRREEHLPFVHWSLQYTLAQIQQGFDGLFHNMGFPFKGPITLWSRANSIGSMPSDKLGREVALGLQKPGAERDALTAGTYIPPDTSEALGRLENAFKLVYEADPIAKKVMKAVRFGELAMDRIDRLAMKAIDAGIITQQEAVLLVVAEEARTDAIQVDSFTLTGHMHQEPERSSVRKVA